MALTSGISAAEARLNRITDMVVPLMPNADLNYVQEGVRLQPGADIFALVWVSLLVGSSG